MRFQQVGGDVTMSAEATKRVLSSQGVVSTKRVSRLGLFILLNEMGDWLIRRLREKLHTLRSMIIMSFAALLEP